MEVTSPYILNDLLRKDVFLRVPFFQRRYAWGRKEWRQLWEDIARLAEDSEPEASHFTGTLVTSPFGSVFDPKKFLIIDGQQRLTTLSLFLVALREKCKCLKLSPLATEIQNKYLTNEYEQGDDRLKIQPNGEDLNAYRTLILGEQLTGVPHPMQDAVKFFGRELNQVYKERVTAGVGYHEFLYDVLRKGAQRLQSVWISLGEKDNPYLVFESLNGKGLALTQSDLLRNYTLMQFGEAERQEEISKGVWLRLDEVFGKNPKQDASKDIEEFFRFYLVGRIKGNVTRKEIYQRGKEYFDILQKQHLLQDELTKIADLAPFYKSYLTPDPDRDEGEFFDNFCAFSYLGTAVVAPIVLLVGEGWKAGRISTTDADRVFTDVLSYVLRRRVCLDSSAGENKQLGVYCVNEIRQLLEEDRGSEIPRLISDHLESGLGSYRWPDNVEFKRALIERPLKKPGTGKSDPGNWIVRCLAEAMDDEETWLREADWKIVALDLGGGVILENLKFTLGNLVFIPKPERDPKNFKDWRKLLLSTEVNFNADIALADEWSSEAIKRRGEGLAKLALKLWPYPDEGVDKLEF